MRLDNQASVLDPSILRTCCSVKLQLLIAPSVSSYFIAPIRSVRETIIVKFVAPYQIAYFANAWVRGWLGFRLFFHRHSACTADTRQDRQKHIPYMFI